MKILHVITSLRTGGAEKLMVDLLPRLRDLGNEVELLCFDGTRTPFYEQLEATGIRIHSLGMRSNVYHPSYLFRFVRFLKKHKYDVVHTHNTAPQLFAAIGGVLCSVVLVTTEHNTSNRRRGWTWYRPIDRAMYAAYRRIICISDAAEKNLRESLNHTKDPKICTIYNGVDVHRFAKATPAPDLHPRPGRKVLVMVAGFRYQKDQDTLIRTLSLLPEDGYELWLVGNGERRGELERLCAELGVSERVRFLGIRMDVPAVLKASDVVVMSSHFEGLSLSNIEGMSVGKPFMASDVDGLREVTQGAGVLFEHGNAEQLAAEIRKLAEDKAYYGEVAARCKERALQYDISVMAASYNKVYRNIVEER